MSCYIDLYKCIYNIEIKIYKDLFMSKAKLVKGELKENNRTIVCILTVFNIVVLHYVDILWYILFL